MEEMLTNLEDFLAALQELMDLMKLAKEKTALCIERGIRIPEKDQKK